MNRRDAAGGENELTKEGTVAAFNGTASFKCLSVFTTRKNNLGNFMKW